MHITSNGLLAAMLAAALFAAAPQAGAQSAAPSADKAPGALPAGVKKINDDGAFTQYAIYNDDKAIYIQLYIEDSLQKMKVLKNGMQVWVDVKGKKNKATGISFPLSAAIGATSFNPGGSGMQGRDTALAMLIAKRQYAEFTGFAEGINGKQNITALPLTGFIVALSVAGDTLVYQAVVPLSALTEKPSADKPISIGIVEKGVELPGFGDMGGGPDGGGPPGGGDAGPPTGPPPGDMQDGGVDYKRVFETNVIWYKIKLHN